MTPPPTLADSVVSGNPDRSHPSASAGGMVSERGGVGAGRGVSTPPTLVNRAIGIITTDPRPILDDTYYQNYRDFLLGVQQRSSVHACRAIAGMGTVQQDSCGKVRHWAACSKDKGHGSYPLKEHCDDPECPVCWTGWATKQARKVSERLRGYIAAARPNTLEGGHWFREKKEDQCFQYYDPELGKFWEVGHWENAQNVRHFLLSAPPAYQGQERDITPDMTTAKIHAIGKFWAKWVGIRGGMMVFHPWRILPDIQHKLTALIPRGRNSQEEHEKKFWQIVREQALPSSQRTIDLERESWHSCVYWSPHFHIIGFGYICDSPNFKRLTGWLVKEVRDISQEKEWTGRQMKDDIAAAAYYMLSHCNIEWGKKSVMWLGCMTPLNLKRLKEKPEVRTYPRECKICQAQEIVYELDDKGDIGKPSLNHDGEWQCLSYREKMYRYHIVTGEEKNARREQRRKERERQREGPAGPGRPGKEVPDMGT